jgi:Mg-chelatase subunit ChlI
MYLLGKSVMARALQTILPPIAVDLDEGFSFQIDPTTTKSGVNDVGTTPTPRSGLQNEQHRNSTIIIPCVSPIHCKYNHKTVCHLVDVE